MFYCQIYSSEEIKLNDNPITNYPKTPPQDWSDKWTTPILKIKDVEAGVEGLVKPLASYSCERTRSNY